LARRVAAISGNRDFHQRVGEALAGRFEDEEPSPHVEERIYGGFFSQQDSGRMRRFHAADWPERVEILDQLEDERLREQGLRMIHAECPDALPARLRTERERWVAERILGQGNDVPWLTVPKALIEADDLMRDATPEQRRLLEGIKGYLEGLAHQYGGP
jgi:exonuclease I